MAQLVNVWRTEPDYSHGMLLPLVLVGVLWLRRHRLQSLSLGSQRAWGLLWITASVALRLAGLALYLDALDGWALVCWLVGAVHLAYGAPVALATAPVLALCLFAIPLPHKLEYLFSQPLQRIATSGSVWLLQTLGEPAFAEGNVIVLGSRLLEVERACAGLRIFMGLTALAVVWALVSTGPLATRLVLLASAVPAAVLANILRIVMTALTYEYGPPWLADRLVHDAAGWIMIPLAMALIGLLHWQWSSILTESAPLRASDVLHPARGLDKR